MALDLTNKDDITAWIRRLNDVDEEAAHQIWMAYFPKLVRLARSKLEAHPRRSADEEDMALSALNSFFRGAQEGRFQLHDRHDLWKLLTTITLRKVGTEYRRIYAVKRGGGKVRGESALESDQHSNSRSPGLAELALDENRLPELAEDVARMCGDLLGQLKDPKLKKTALMKMEGFTNREISDHLSCSVSRTKQRLALIRAKWQDEVAPDND